MKYAIKYLKMRYDDETDILIPKGLVKGDVSEGEYFNTNDAVYNYITKQNLDGKYVIGDATTIEELRDFYQVDGESFDDDELVNFFYYDQCDKLSVLKFGRRMSIDLFELFDDDQEKAIYELLDGEACLFLNQKIVDVLLETEDITILKEILKSYSDRIANFESRSENEGIESILVKDGHVTEITRFTDDEIEVGYVDKTKKTAPDINSDEFSVNGLYEHLKSNIMGHDDELKNISTILCMNYFSEPTYGTESILIPGPTGTGKTATFNCAASYFDIPFKNINTCNLVPEGIVGTTIEDEFASLIDACKGDMSKAEKAIIVFDEFDKLGVDSLDLKTSLVNVFLKVLEGSSFPINRQNQRTKNYDTTMASKICLGTFVEAYKNSKTIGFENSAKKEVFDKNLLVGKGYFSQELLTRLQHFIPYQELSELDKKRIILESKLSAYLLKKERLEKQFGITIDGDEDFAFGVLEALKKDDKSVRDINNIIASTFLNIEYEILANRGKYRTLSLYKDTVSGNKFDLR